MTNNSINLVVVGDSAVGKTCLIESYVKHPFPETYIPTVFEKYTGSLIINGESVDLKIWDTAGQSDHHDIRGLTYSEVDAVILCFSVVHEISYENVRCKWSDELFQRMPKVPIVLVGTKTDLRERVIPGISRVISYDQGSRLAKRINADSYVECSSLANFNVKQVFDQAIKVALERRAEARSPSKRSPRKQDKSRSQSRHGRRKSVQHKVI
ncbi:Small GTPase Rac protein 43 [Fasciola gigantica]|uniref:Small GTPase Rac protein 43 n=1 Tax=Fasciola gigantica TaxID=46835 RepID=A0A504Z4H7_FASGI|nr:Small GTPase Rac protein 43 [Fasciola gigantica]